MFFEIQADQACSVHSRRPSNLEKRFSRRTKSVDLQLEEVSAKRESILNERRERIAQRWNRILRAVNEKRQIEKSNTSQINRDIADSLESAQKKREALLQQKEEKMAKHVSHAKEIAEKANAVRKEKASMSRKKMEKRLQESLVRRQVLSKIPRSKLLDEEFIEIELAKYKISAKKIQMWWRQQVLQKNIAEFKQGTGLFGDQLASAKFERLAPMLQNKKVIAITSKLLLQSKKMSANGRARRFKNPTRVFLSSFLIAFHTQEIMPEFGAQEETVKLAAVEMLKQFNELLQIGTLKNVKEFNEAWHKYHMAFEQWKLEDTEKILNYMFDHFMQLEKLRESIQTSEPGAKAEWNPQIEKQQEMIKSKVLKLGGKSALQRFMNGQKKFREMSDSSDAEVMSDSSPARMRPDSVTNSRYENNSPLASPKPENAPSPSMVPQAPQLQDVFSEFGGMMTNEKLAHELIMNPDFELKMNEQSLEGQIRLVAKKAFFDKIRQDMSQEKFDWVPGMIQDIRTQLLEMIPERSSIRVEVSEGLDDKLIHQQVEKQAFDFTPYIQFVISKMLQLCAPVRDSSIRQIALMPDLVSQLEAILTIIDDMKLDLANFRLRALRPHLMPQAVEYERSKFAAALEAGNVQLSLTEKWLTGSVRSLEEKIAARNPENVDHPENRVRYDQIYFDALLSLIFNPESQPPEELAETLFMDRERVANLQNEVRAITVVSALVMLTRNFASDTRDDSKFQAMLKQNLFLLLEEPHTTADHLSLHIVTAVNDFLVARGRKQKLSADQESMIKSMVEKTLTFKDTVYSLLNRRISQSIRSHLISGRVRRDSNSGLEIVQKEVDSISDRLFIFAKHNRSVFAPWYDQIISQSIQQ